MSGATSGGAPEGGDGGAVANGAPAAAPYPQQRATEEMLWAFVRALKAENDQLRRQVQGAQVAPSNNESDLANVLLNMRTSAAPLPMTMDPAMFAGMMPFAPPPGQPPMPFNPAFAMVGMPPPAMAPPMPMRPAPFPTTLAEVSGGPAAVAVRGHAGPPIEGEALIEDDSAEMGVDAPFLWTPCASPARACPPEPAPEAAPPAGSTAVAETRQPPSLQGVQAAFETPLLYWRERTQWMWHKKWTLPRLTVTVNTGAEESSVGSAPLVAMVTCGTLSPAAGHEELQHEGLSGQCTQRLVRRTGSELEATFSSLHLQHTSSQCGNRPFHLVITVAVMGPHGPQRPLASISSPALHVDARKRTKGERPGSNSSDVRLMTRKARGLGRGGGGGGRA
mmetsp:Transcript_28084/g.82884  ORF Transcript_28084/g.82884 Transcript_28084/m.82884 type:complete len:392 (+) Transcript_28084:48-1223(+)